MKATIVRGDVRTGARWSGAVEESRPPGRARETARRDAAVRESRSERLSGYGIMAQPFDSGHVLALRVFTESDHGPFRALWHRPPSGRWSMYVDGQDPERFCPRFFGPILERYGKARIDVSRSRADRLVVRVDEPSLEWTVRLRSSALTRVANQVLPRIPLEIYRRESTLHLVRALADRALGLGPVDLYGTFPAGQRALVHPRRLLLVGDARAHLEGEDLGRAVRAAENPVTGSFRWPARGVLAEGEIYVDGAVPPTGAE